MPKESKINLQALTKEEQEEIAMLKASKEVKAAREAEKAKQYLYSLRCLYKKGKKLLEGDNQWTI